VRIAVVIGAAPGAPAHAIERALKNISPAAHFNQTGIKEHRRQGKVASQNKQSFTIASCKSFVCGRISGKL
jgi:hypothetical protein